MSSCITLNTYSMSFKFNTEKKREVLKWSYKTSGQSRLIWYEAATRRRTRTVQSYSPGSANVTPSSTPHRHPHRTDAGPCWVSLSISTVEDVWACSGMSLFALKNCPFTCGDQNLHLTHPSPRPKRHHYRFCCFFRARGRDRQTNISTDRQTD